MLNSVYELLHYLFYNSEVLTNAEEIALEIWSFGVALFVFCLPFICVWWVIKRFL